MKKEYIGKIIIGSKKVTPDIDSLNKKIAKDFFDDLLS
jgi:hypothetical protein